MDNEIVVNGLSILVMLMVDDEHLQYQIYDQSKSMDQILYESQDKKKPQKWTGIGTCKPRFVDVGCSKTNTHATRITLVYKDTHEKRISFFGLTSIIPGRKTRAQEMKSISARKIPGSHREFRLKFRHLMPTQKCDGRGLSTKKAKKIFGASQSDTCHLTLK